MKITSNQDIKVTPNTVIISTVLGDVTAHISKDGTVSVSSGYNQDGSDRYVSINGVDYRFNAGIESSVGGTTIYRKGKYLDGDGVTEKAKSTIQKVAKEVQTFVKTQKCYSDILDASRVAAIQKEIAYKESELAKIQAQIEALKAQL